jgi:GT2 family glycosyltransferase/tetratricopeptide (TPR) repeat protein
MRRKYLFGPVTEQYAEQNLPRARESADCVPFSASGDTGLGIRADDSWSDVCARLPEGWRPDFVALYLPYTTIPRCLWSAPIPVIGLAADWNLLWHYYRACLGECDLVLTDTSGVEALARQGITHARAANLFGCERALVEEAWPEQERSFDVLFVGNLHPAVQRERLPWVSRLARLADRWRVEIRTGVYGAEYRDLLGRARIVFNRAIRGECNKRVFEAAAAGALLFQEAGNLEVPAIFRDRQECVYYTEDDLEELLRYYLENEDERRRIAEAGRALVGQYTFEALWDEQLAKIERGWSVLVERARRRSVRQAGSSPVCQTWQALASTDGGDPRLAANLAGGLVQEPGSAWRHNALGVATAVTNTRGRTVTGECARQVEGYFRRALEYDPADPVAGLNYAEALLGCGRDQEAAEQARRTLVELTKMAVDAPRSEAGPSWLDAPHFPPAFDTFRVEWERAAWGNAGRPDNEARTKRELLRWRLHSLLGDVAGSAAHYYEAALARPDLPGTRAALGCALARAGQPAAAVPHLQAAVDGNPFDLDAARALFQAMGEAGDSMGQRRLAAQRRLLAEAAPQVVPAERWFLDTPPAGDELASIIVLCCNEIEYTRLCLESVIRHTRLPYELVLVENGSTDGTLAFLEELSTRPGPGRVVVIRNETNVGFAAGCNQALARARGRYLVFLNNDAVVTPGWLVEIVRWALHDWPKVGLVGPVSNYAPPPQLVEAGYRGLDGLDAFAGRWRQQHAGQALGVERLTGFCLLVRREVLKRVGAFDECYGHGFFEDDDLCVRAREAGFGLLVAQDVYVHHFGSRTFKALGIDGPAQLRRNFEQFRDKWGEERSAGYRVPNQQPEFSAVAPASPPAEDASRAWRSPAGRLAERDAYIARVSLCMIVRNEEQNLPECLGSVAGLVDEVVVVDTGSTDGTREVAEQMGARVFDYPWVDDFAAARNESLRHARGEWVFWMDADDRIDGENAKRLRALFDRLDGDNAAYVMKCRCAPDPHSGVATAVDHVRLFRNHSNIRWKYRVHEQILPAVRRQGAEVRATEIVIEHVGYLDPALRARKQERDLRLLRLDLEDNPDDPFTLFNLGWSYEESGRAGDALPLLERSLALSQPSDSIVRKLCALILDCHRKLGRQKEALAVCRDGRRYYPDDAQLLFQESLLLREQGDRAGAEACLLRLLSTSEGPHFASAAEGLRGHLARHNLAVMYQEEGRDAEAEAQWRAALAERPGYAHACLGLGELLLRQGRYGEVEELAVRASNRANSQTWVGNAALRARVHLERGDYGAARAVLDEAIAETPRSALLWMVLSHVLLREGRDLDGAHEALCRVLELEPGNADARHNLAVLESRQTHAAT